MFKKVLIFVLSISRNIEFLYNDIYANYLKIHSYTLNFYLFSKICQFGHSTRILSYQLGIF